MSEYAPDTYGERIADIYDMLHPPERTDAARIAEVLARLAGAGPALELGIGTGRIALPLHEHGVAVQGIDASPAIVARLHAKPGGERIPVTLGNFADLGVEGRFALIYVVFDTFFCLASQEEQVRCFANAAAHLLPDGVFLIEEEVPEIASFSDGQRVRAVRLQPESMMLCTATHEPLAQRIFNQDILISETGIRLLPTWQRYAWPAELDLMARLAGLRLRERWGGWQQEPFTAASGKHVSLYTPNIAGD